MAKAVIVDKDKDLLRRVSEKDYGVINIADLKPGVVIEDTLPFRIRFTNIGIPGYSPRNPAPIGIAVVGYNNYIL
jgi:hypothetical protein